MIQMSNHHLPQTCLLVSGARISCAATLTGDMALQAVAGHLLLRTAHYHPQTLSSVLWAYATQEVYPGIATMDAAASFICNNLQVGLLLVSGPYTFLHTLPALIHQFLKHHMLHHAAQ